MDVSVSWTLSNILSQTIVQSLWVFWRSHWQYGIDLLSNLGQDMKENYTTSTTSAALTTTTTTTTKTAAIASVLRILRCYTSLMSSLCFASFKSCNPAGGILLEHVPEFVTALGEECRNGLQVLEFLVSESRDLKLVSKGEEGLLVNFVDLGCCFMCKRLVF
jgi:hypothetical protein